MKDKVYRHQMDNCQDEVALACGIHCTPEEDRTRQEFRDEVDVNMIVLRAGGGLPLQNPVIYGEVNYDLNLQDALEAVSSARQAWAKQPDEVRARFTGFPDLYDAVASGRVVLSPLEPKATPVVVPVEPQKPAVS